MLVPHCHTDTTQSGIWSDPPPDTILLSCYCTVLYCTVLYCTVLYCTVLYCTVLYCTVLYCTVLYCTVLYCTVLYCTVLYYIVLYCTVSPPEELEVGGHRPPYLQVYKYLLMIQHIIVHVNHCFIPGSSS